MVLGSIIGAGLGRLPRRQKVHARSASFFGTAAAVHIGVAYRIPQQIRGSVVADVPI